MNINLLNMFRSVTAAVTTPAVLVPGALLLGGAVAYATTREVSGSEPEAEADDGEDDSDETTASPVQIPIHHLMQTPGVIRGARLGKFSADARAKVNDPRALHHRGRVFEEADIARHNLLHWLRRCSLTEKNAKAVDATVNRTGQPIQHKTRYGYFNKRASDATKLSTNKLLHEKALRSMADTTGRDDGVVRTTRGGGTGLSNVEESRISEEDLMECIRNESRAASFNRACGLRAIEGALLAASMAAVPAAAGLLNGDTTFAAAVGDVVEALVGGGLAEGVSAAVSWVGGTLFVNANLVTVVAMLAGAGVLWLYEATGLGRRINRLVRRMVRATQRVARRLATRIAMLAREVRGAWTSVASQPAWA